jgi:hypothetical protein
MMRRISTICAALVLALPASTALHASEAEFLQQFSGNWSGGGQVRLSPESSPVNVSCDFDGQATESSASLDGICTGMILFSRQVGAELALQNGSYVGSYVGSQRGTAELQGTRSGSSLDLSLQWPGHPPASMTLASPGEGRMVLTTVEEHPETGEQVVTAQLELQRQ